MNELMDYLEKNGVETRMGFIPCHLQPPYKQKGDYPIAEELSKISIYLPSGSDLTKEEKDIVINLIKKFYEK